MSEVAPLYWQASQQVSVVPSTAVPPVGAVQCAVRVAALSRFNHRLSASRTNDTSGIDIHTTAHTLATRIRCITNHLHVFMHGARSARESITMSVLGR